MFMETLVCLSKETHLWRSFRCSQCSLEQSFWFSNCAFRSRAWELLIRVRDTQPSGFLWACLCSCCFQSDASLQSCVFLRLFFSQNPSACCVCLLRGRITSKKLSCVNAASRIVYVSPYPPLLLLSLWPLHVRLPTLSKQPFIFYVPPSEFYRKSSSCGFISGRAMNFYSKVGF